MYMCTGSYWCSSKAPKANTQWGHKCTTVNMTQRTPWMEKEICLVQQTLERKKKEEEQEEEEGATKSFGHEMFFVFFCLFGFFFFCMKCRVQNEKERSKKRSKLISPNMHTRNSSSVISVSFCFILLHEKFIYDLIKSSSCCFNNAFNVTAWNVVFILNVLCEVLLHLFSVWFALMKPF